MNKENNNEENKSNNSRKKGDRKNDFLPSQEKVLLDVEPPDGGAAAKKRKTKEEGVGVKDASEKRKKAKVSAVLFAVFFENLTNNFLRWLSGEVGKFSGFC